MCKLITHNNRPCAGHILVGSQRYPLVGNPGFATGWIFCICCGVERSVSHVIAGQVEAVVTNYAGRNGRQNECFNTRWGLRVKLYCCWAVRVLDVTILLYYTKRNSARIMKSNELQSLLHFSCKGILSSVNHFAISQNVLLLKTVLSQLAHSLLQNA